MESAEKQDVAYLPELHEYIPPVGPVAHRETSENCSRDGRYRHATSRRASRLPLELREYIPPRACLKQSTGRSPWQARRSRRSIWLHRIPQPQFFRRGEVLAKSCTFCVRTLVVSSSIPAPRADISPAFGPPTVVRAVPFSRSRRLFVRRGRAAPPLGGRHFASGDGWTAEEPRAQHLYDPTGPDG